METYFLTLLAQRAFNLYIGAGDLNLGPRAIT